MGSPAKHAHAVALLGSRARTSALAERLAARSVQQLASLEDLAKAAPAELLIVWPESLGASAGALAAAIANGAPWVANARVLACLSADGAAHAELWLGEIYDDVVADTLAEVEGRVMASEWLARAHVLGKAPPRATGFGDQIVDTVSSMVVVMDRAGIIVAFNPACERVTGYKAAEILGRTIFETFLRPEDVPAVHAVFDRLAAGLFPNSHDNYWRAKDGSLRWIQWNNTAQVGADGAVDYVIGTGIDLTEKVALARALDTSEARLREWIRRLPDAVFVHRAGKIVFVNDALSSTLGWPSAVALIGASLDRIFASGELEALTLETNTLVEDGDTHPPREVRLVDTSARVVPTEVVSMRTLFEGEAAVLSVARDLTARRELTTRMFQVDRTMMLGTVAAGIGHEINNPLTFVIGNLELVKESLRGMLTSAAVPLVIRDQVATLSVEVADALEGSLRIAAIVRDLKQLTRSSDDTTASVEVEPLLESLLKVAAHEIKHRAQIERVYGGVAPIRGAEARVAQVFLNLLLNAAQAIVPGDADRQRITLRTKVDGAWGIIEVSDSGCGMTEAVLPRIFEPFFTTKTGEGTGLGLAITRQIVVSLGGTITAESTPGVGSTFRVRLPLAQAGAPRRSTTPSAAPTASTRARILAVEDEQQLAIVLERLLLPEHDVVSVNSGRAALDILVSGAPPPDVVLCDIMMPAMTGIELYEEVSKQRPELARRFVFMTGGTFTRESAAFVKSVGLPIVDKPFDVATLRAAILAVLSGSAVLRRA
jgi:PAS domain S-box-containing protein